MLMAQLDEGIKEVTKLVYGNYHDDYHDDDSHFNENDRSAARRKVKELKDTLKKLKE